MPLTINGQQDLFLNYSSYPSKYFLSLGSLAQDYNDGALGEDDVHYKSLWFAKHQRMDDVQKYKFEAPNEEQTPP